MTAEIIKDNPGVYSVGRRGRAVRARGAVRRAAARHARASTSTRSARTASDRSSSARRPTTGTPLHLTLEPRLQLLAEHILSTVGPASAIVAIKPSTGAILAAANGPGNNGYNDATYGRFAPGSTFKTVGSLALLKKGQTPSSPVDCPTSVTVDGKVFTNDSYYPPSANGRITLATRAGELLQHGVHQRAHQARLDTTSSTPPRRSAWASTTTSASRRTSGNVVPPTSETDQGRRHDRPGPDPGLADDDGDGDGVGRGRAHGRAAADHVGEPREDLARAADGARRTRRSSRCCAGSSLSGTGIGLRDVPGPPVIAKTGTAEFDRGGQRLTHAWMIAGQGDLAVCAFVDVGQTGAGTAGPLLEQFLRGALAADPRHVTRLKRAHRPPT